MLQGHSGGAVKHIYVRGLQCARNRCSSQALETGARGLPREHGEGP